MTGCTGRATRRCIAHQLPTPFDSPMIRSHTMPWKEKKNSRAVSRSPCCESEQADIHFSRISFILRRSVSSSELIAERKNATSSGSFTASSQGASSRGRKIPLSRTLFMVSREFSSMEGKRPASVPEGNLLVRPIPNQFASLSIYLYLYLCLWRLCRTCQNRPVMRVLGTLTNYDPYSS